MKKKPEITEYITGDGWTLSCQDRDCNWIECAERTEYFVEELNEAFERHMKWHEDGCPQ